VTFDPGLARLLRDDLSGEPFTETRMFGGLCFLTYGHMICGVHQGGTMYRVGKDRYAAALDLPGAAPVLMGDRVMAAMVQLSPEDSADDAKRAALLALALSTVRDLPPKVAKPRKG